MGDACIPAITFDGSYSNHTEVKEVACCNHGDRDKVVEEDIHYNSCFMKDDASFFGFDSC